MILDAKYAEAHRYNMEDSPYASNRDCHPWG